MKSKCKMSCKQKIHYPFLVSMRTNGKVLHVGSELFSFTPMIMYRLSCAACAF